MATCEELTPPDVPEDDTMSVGSLDTHMGVVNPSEMLDGKRRSFLDAKTLQPSPRGFGPRVNASLVHNTDTMDDRDHLHRLVTSLAEAAEQKRLSDINFIPQVLMFPDLVQQKNMALMADMLSKNNEGAQRRACSVLETLLVEIQSSEDTGLTEGLMKVAESTWSVFERQTATGRLLHDLACLHLMTASAILSRCPRPTFDQYLSHVPASNPKRRGRTTSNDDSLKGILLAAMNLFYKVFKEQLKTPPYPAWGSVDWFLEGSSERKRHFSQASFCQLIVYAFTLLNEVAEEGWSELGKTMLDALRDLFESLQQTGRHKNCYPAQAARVAFNFLLVRGLLVLLRNTFDAGIHPVGDRQCNHIEFIAELILDVIRSASSDSQKKRLIQDVCDLPFHNDICVRQKFGCCLRTEGPSLCQLALKYLENNLQVINFRQNPVDASGAPSRRPEAHEVCDWVTFKATVCQKPAEGAMFVPKASCMAKTADQIFNCIDQHPGCTEDDPDTRIRILALAKRHRNNLDMLKVLVNPEGKHILKLLAYQIKPFPVYVVESVEDRRLIGFLMHHRKEGMWLVLAVLVRICTDVADALLYLYERGVINCDITTYNMIVEDASESRRSFRGHAPQVFPTGKFAVKLADLGLAYKLDNNETTVQLERDQGPIPVRWTAPEALFDGRHSEKSMVYGLGCVMYELWTHGCQPFTKYDEKWTTAEILSELRGDAPHRVRLHHWPCIPEPVYKLLKRCTDVSPTERPSLEEVKTELRNVCHVDDSDEESEPELNATLRRRQLYPIISDDQERRKHKPERGTSVVFDKECLRVI